MKAYLMEIWSIRSLRTLLIISTVIYPLIVVLSTLIVTIGNRSDRVSFHKQLGLPIDTPPMLLAILGVIAISSIISNNYINFSLLANPNRDAVALNRGVAMILWAFAATIAGMLVSAVAVFVVLVATGASGINFDFVSTLQEFLKALIISGAYMATGYGIGLLTRSASLGTIILLALLWGLPIFLTVLQSYVSWAATLIKGTPMMLTTVVSGQMDGSSWVIATCGILAWGMAALIAGVIGFRRYSA